MLTETSAGQVPPINFKMNSKLISFIIAIGVAIEIVQSAPTSTGAANTLSQAGRETTTTSRGIVDQEDYVGETEFDAVMNRIRNESLTYDPANYVSDDFSLEEIISLIDADNQRSTTTTVSAGQALSFTTTQASITGNVIGSSQSSALNERAPATEGPEECPICYEPLQNQKTTETLCKHKFHYRCLGDWKHSLEVSNKIFSPRIEDSRS